MIVNGDVKALEVVVVADLSQDKVLKGEITDKQDIHQNNIEAFGLPDRITAKRFKFKLIYGASAYGFANDPDFFDVSKSESFWQEVIDNYYKKYYGIAAWHSRLQKMALSERKLVIPSGRYFPIEPTINNNRVKWPTTIIKNYPVK